MHTSRGKYLRNVTARLFPAYSVVLKRSRNYLIADSIYTERFMGLPTVADNMQGYEQGQLLNKVDNIKNKMYYLIHGTLDDNVHYQQSLMLAKVLEQRDILFRQQVSVSLAEAAFPQRSL